MWYTLERGADVLDVGALNSVRLVVVAHVDGNTPGEHVWRESLPRLKCLIYICPNLHSRIQSISLPVSHLAICQCPLRNWKSLSRQKALARKGISSFG